MTRSPLTVTLLPLLPLAALALPLSRVLNQKAYQQTEPVQEEATGPIVTADLFIKSAHPFERLSASIGDATWTFEPDDEVKEIHYPAQSAVTITVEVVWPPDTPESAVQITLEPLKPTGRPGRSHTFWGFSPLEDLVTFTWGDES